MLAQQLLDHLGLVGSVIVYEHNHPALWMGRQLVRPRNGGQQTSEADVVAPRMDYMHSMTRKWVDRSPIPAFLGTHAGRQDDPLLSNGHPAASNRREQTEFGRVAKQQDLFWPGRGSQLTDPFFSLQRVEDLAYAERFALDDAVANHGL